MSCPKPNIYSFKATAAVAAYKAVKIGADAEHVSVGAAGTDKLIGIVQNDVTVAEDIAEVALPGGGAKALLGGTVAAGDLLTSNASGALVATVTANDKVIAQALAAGVSGDVIPVNVVVSNF